MILRQKIFVSILFFGLANINLSFSQTYNFDSLKKTISENKGTEREIDLLVEISENYKANNIDTALYYILLAIEKAKSIEYSKGYINSLHTLSSIFLFKNDYKNAFKYAEQSLIESQKSKNKELIGISKTYIAVIYAESGNYTLSTKYNFEALEIFEEIENKLQIETVYGNIGADYYEQENYEKSLEYQQKALDIAFEIKDTVGIAYIYNNIGIIYFSHFQDNTKALYYFRSALSINKKLKNYYLQGLNFINIGSVFIETASPDSALYYYQTALDIFTKLDSKANVSNCYFLIGEIFFSQNDFINSIYYAELSNKLSIENSYLNMTKNATTLLHKSYLALNDTIKAYEYFVLEKKINDSLDLVQNKQEIQKIEFQYQIEKETQQRKIIQTKRNFIYAIIFILLIVFILLIILSYSRQKIKVDIMTLKNQKIQSELDFKNKEITVNLLSISKVKEILDLVSEKLQFIEKKATEKFVKNNIIELEKEITKLLDDKLGQELSLRFNEVNNDFYEKLTEKFPNITPNDLKMCAFLRLNMSSKDISLITGQRVETIESARYRLRKRLGIVNSDTNLVEFLSQF